MALRLQRNRSTPALADTANSPRQAAAAASAAAASAAAASGEFFPKSGRSGVFLVEDVERPQADVGDFFLTESDLGRGGIPRRYFRGRHSSCCGRAACQRQRHADNSHYRYGFLRIFSLRTTLRLRHSRVLPRLLANIRRPERYSYALPMHLARPIARIDWHGLPGPYTSRGDRRQRERLFIRHADRRVRSQNALGGSEFPDFM